MTTISEILYEAISDALDNGVDLSTSSKRNEFREKFLKDNPELKIHRTTFVKAFKEVFKDRNIDWTSVKLTRKKRYNVDLARKMQEQNKISKEQQVAVQQELPTIMPQTDYEIAMHAAKNNAWTRESVRAFWRCITNPLDDPRIRLSDNEIDVLAEMWTPAFNKYASEKIRVFALLALGTFTVLGKHISRGYALHKEAEIQNNNSE